jgi:N-acetylglucosamine-6-phosphate deacetylase
MPPYQQAAIPDKQNERVIMFLRNIIIYGTNGKSRGDIYIGNDGKLIINPEKNTLAGLYSVTDADGKLALMPGFLDAHIHGFGGHDFSDINREKLAQLMKALGGAGLSYCVATIVSLSIDKIKANLAVINDYMISQAAHPVPGSANIVGVHLEGPFISKSCKGAHDEAVLRDAIDVALFKDIISAAPAVTDWKITLSPDIRGAIDFIRQTRDLTVDGRKIHVHVFIGHTNASEELIDEAIRAGASGFTHLGNANQEQATRSKNFEPAQITSNVLKWVLHHAANHAACAELIFDGEHISPAYGKFVDETFNNNIMLVTDALGPSGLNDGEYMLGSLGILKRGEIFVLRDNPEKLAGSAATFASVVQKYHRSLAGEDDATRFDKVFRAAVLNPVKTSVHAPEKLLNDAANWVVLNNSGEVVLSSCNGKIARNAQFAAASRLFKMRPVALADSSPALKHFSK